MQILQRIFHETLWVTRITKKSTGTTFDVAYQELTYVANDYFLGKMNGLSKRRTDDTSKVEIGDKEVLNTVKEQ